MSTSDIMSHVEYQAIQLERACAVLSEVEHYFEVKDDVKWLPYYADHILLLLHAADALLYSMIPELNGAVEALLEKSKEEKQKQ